MTSACLNDTTKQQLISEIEKHVTDTNKAQVLAEYVEQLPTCTISELTKGKKKMRPLTAYNIYIGKCIKSTGKSMKDCVVGWREEKERKKQQGG